MVEKKVRKEKIVPQSIRKVIEATRDIYTLKHMFVGRGGYVGEVWSIITIFKYFKNCRVKWKLDSSVPHQRSGD